MRVYVCLTICLFLKKKKKKSKEDKPPKGITAY